MAVADSPVMRQYAALKAAHPDALLMFRMGDFYELFGDDALAASATLQITLTRRRTAQDGDAGIPMCGVPYHAAEGYIGKLLQAGFTVALTEQTETPAQAKARGGKTLVSRDVVRIYTPGTLTEDAYLDPTQPRLLVALVADPHAPARGVLATLDLAAGEVTLRGVALAHIGHTLAGLPVSEAVVDAGVDAAVLPHIPRRAVRVQPQLFVMATARNAIGRAYQTVAPEGLGLREDADVLALGALLGYAELTQMGKLPALRAPLWHTANRYLFMDASTRKNLELTDSLAGGRSDSLLGVMDHTATAAGARLLARWVSEPLADVEAIGARHDAVGTLVHDTPRRATLRACLKDTGDIARAVSRLLLGRGGPRDLALVRQTGATLPALQAALPATAGLLAHTRAGLEGLESLTATLQRMLGDDPLPALVREGGFMRDGVDPELDRARTLMTRGQDLLAELETRETRDGLSPKVRYNSVWGYYFDISNAQLERATPPAHWVHRQTTTTGQRFSSAELMALERDLGHAGQAAQSREEQLLRDMVDHVRHHATPLLAASEALATLDVLTTLAEVAARNGWVRPTVDTSFALEIDDGKHPVVAARVADFVPNSCHLSDGKLWLLTGPNMAGKSTFLRQNVLLVVLAQMGSFVPAVRMHLGVADAIFSRIGAADNLAAGQSTFMVEMVETAAILNRATARSVVILDELGRGTSTYDGLAIAWACVEDLATRVRSRTLFATHYHELTQLESTLDPVSCHHVAVKEWKGDIVFLHRVMPGAAAGSYGVHVAKLAGLPTPVLARAQALLDGFASVAKQRSPKGGLNVTDLGLFAAPVAAPQVALHPLEARVRGTDVDSLSARDALALLYELRGMV